MRIINFRIVFCPFLVYRGAPQNGWRVSRHGGARAPQWQVMLFTCFFLDNKVSSNSLGGHAGALIMS